MKPNTNYFFSQRFYVAESYKDFSILKYFETKLLHILSLSMFPLHLSASSFALVFGSA